VGGRSSAKSRRLGASTASKVSRYLTAETPRRRGSRGEAPSKLTSAAPKPATPI
jgi:hypothetical protein